MRMFKLQPQPRLTHHSTLLFFLEQFLSDTEMKRDFGVGCTHALNA